LLTRPGEQSGERDFTIAPGEDVATLAERLAAAGVIRDAGAFRAYLIYSGLDTSIQAGEYALNLLSLYAPTKEGNA